MHSKNRTLIVKNRVAIILGDKEKKGEGDSLSIDNNNRMQQDSSGGLVKTLQNDIPGDCKQQSNTVIPVNNR